MRNKASSRRYTIRGIPEEVDPRWQSGWKPAMKSGPLIVLAEIKAGFCGGAQQQQNQVVR
jgi:hypothetical protein